MLYYRCMLRTVIIVAAGSGERLGASVPKAFIALSGATLIERSTAVFSNIGVGEIVIVVPVGWEDRAADLTEGFEGRIICVAGGASRTESVRRGFDAIDSDAEIVAIHDAARPLIEKRDVVRTFEAAEKFGAAAPAVPIADTLKATDGEFIVRTLTRRGIFGVQTPQIFRYDLLKRALDSADGDFTDDCALIENIGGKIAIVRGNRTNIKITYPEDIILAEAILKSRKAE